MYIVHTRLFYLAAMTLLMWYKKKMLAALAPPMLCSLCVSVAAYVCRLQGREADSASLHGAV